jgi:tetratricopeptide (TPR) repeat protein
MMGGTDALTTKKSGVNFVDPYELATFDPYNQRNLNDIPCTGKVRIIAETVEHIREKIMNKDDNYYKQDLEQAMENVYQHVIEKENTPLDVDLMARIFFDLYKINLEKTIERFNKLEQFDLYKEAFLKQKEEYEHKQEQKEQLEKTASDHLENEQYNEAIVILKEMLSLDPKDKDLEEIINDTEIQRANVIKKLTDK